MITLVIAGPLRPPVRFRERDHHVGAAVGPVMPLAKHGERLADGAAIGNAHHT